MKYIRQAKNTKMAGKLPDEYVTEHLDESLFNSKHEAMGGWEKVSNAKCKELCDNNEQLLEEFKAAKDAERRSIDNTQKQAKLTEQIKLQEEFEAYKAWKASQGN
jgi:hypothetical protein